MITIAGIICTLICSTFAQTDKNKTNQRKEQIATSGKQGVLTCIAPFSVENVKTAVTWEHDSVDICSVDFNELIECDGLQHDAAKGKMTLTIPKLRLSDAGKYTCSILTSMYGHKCYIDLVVKADSKKSGPGSNGRKADSKKSGPGSNGICIKAGPMFLLLPLAVVIWSFPFILLWDIKAEM